MTRPPKLALAFTLALAWVLALPLAHAGEDQALDTEPTLPAEVLGPSLRPPATPDWSAAGAMPGTAPGTLPGAEPGRPGGQPTAGPAAHGEGWLSGMASFYSQRFHGRPTASGEPYVSQGWTAAHRDLPLDTLLSVRNPANGVEVVVRVNDRGPFHANRMLDLSMAAAQALGLLRQGVAMVVIRPLSVTEADSRALGPQPTAVPWQAAAAPLISPGAPNGMSAVVKGRAAAKKRSAAQQPRRPAKAKRVQPARR